MQVDEKPIVPRQRNLDTNFVDDDELQAALARSRRAKLQKAKKLSPEEIARRSKSACPSEYCTIPVTDSSPIVAEERAKSEGPAQEVIKVEDDDDGDDDDDRTVMMSRTTSYIVRVTNLPLGLLAIYVYAIYLSLSLIDNVELSRCYILLSPSSSVIGHRARHHQCGFFNESILYYLIIS